MSATSRSTWTLLLGLAASCAVVAGCPKVEPPSFQSVDLPPDLGPDQGTVGLATEASLLHGPRALGEVGDWVVRNDRIVAVFRAEDGRLVDMGLRSEGEDLFAGLSTVVSDTRGRYRVFYHTIGLGRPPKSLAFGQAKPEGKVLDLLGRVRDRDLNLEVETWAWAVPGRPILALFTKVRNAGRALVVRAGVGDDAYLGNQHVFVPGHGWVRRSQVLHAKWVGRQGPGFSLALASPGPPTRLEFHVYKPGFEPLVRTTYRYGDLKTGATIEALRFLVLERGALNHAASLVQEALGGTTCQAEVSVPKKMATLGPCEVEVSVHGAPVLEARCESPVTELRLPKGRSSEVRLRLPGAGPGPWSPLPCPGTTSPKAPPSGLLAVTITDETGSPRPARILITGLGETPTPEFGREDRLSGTGNVVYAWKGRARLRLAPGTYLVSAVSGLGRIPAWRKVQVQPGHQSTVQLELLPLPGPPLPIMGDFHLHARPSPDSPLSLATRLGQLVCTGVQVAVATDHNAVTDYRPAAKGLPPMLLVSGDEATTHRSLLGHFNIFPLPAGSAVPPYRNQTASQFFSTWKKLPDAPILQVNHPRFSFMGYFNQMDLDPAWGRAFAPSFRTDFDALEVFNGVKLHSPARVAENLRDWFLLLNQGLRPTATGNSDSHRLYYQEAGYPRNLLVAGPVHLEKWTQELLKRVIRRHGNVVSSGPVLGVSSQGRSVVGATLRPPVRLQVRIRAAPHLAADELLLIRNGRLKARWRLGASSAQSQEGKLLHSVRKDQCAEKFHRAWARLVGCVTLERGPWPPTGPPQNVTLPLVLTPKQDSWYVFLAISHRDNPTLPGRGALVAAFTNPIWVDADGDGTIAPAGGPRPPPDR